MEWVRCGVRVEQKGNPSKISVQQDVRDVYGYSLNGPSHLDSRRVIPLATWIASSYSTHSWLLIGYEPPDLGSSTASTSARFYWSLKHARLSSSFYPSISSCYSISFPISPVPSVPTFTRVSRFPNHSISSARAKRRQEFRSFYGLPPAVSLNSRLWISSYSWEDWGTLKYWWRAYIVAEDSAIYASQLLRFGLGFEQELFTVLGRKQHR